MRTDLLLHALAGFLIALTACFLSREQKLELNLLIGFMASVIAGFGKELVWDDWWELGTPDGKDAFATVWGGLAGCVAWLMIVNVI